MIPVGDILAARLQLSKPVYEDMRCGASGTHPTGPNVPPWDVFLGAIRTMHFRDGFADEVYSQIQFTHGYIIGGTVYPHVHFTPKTADVGTVIWELEYVWARERSHFADPQTLQVTYTIPVGGEQWHHSIAVFDPISGVDANNVTRGLSSMFMFRLARRGDIDTYPADVSLLEFDIHVPIDTLGSFGEYEKFTP